MTMLVRDRRIAPTMPGTNPAINSFPTDISVIKPKITAFVLGGIKAARCPEVPKMPHEYFLG
jgi:hypothetical protein